MSHFKINIDKCEHCEKTHTVVIPMTAPSNKVFQFRCPRTGQQVTFIKGLLAAELVERKDFQPGWIEATEY